MIYDSVHSTVVGLLDIVNCDSTTTVIVKSYSAEPRAQWSLASVALCVCPRSKRKTAWAIHAKLGTHIPYGSQSAYIDPEVRRVKGQGHMVMKTATVAWLLVEMCCCCVGLHVVWLLGVLAVWVRCILMTNRLKKSKWGSRPILNLLICRQNKITFTDMYSNYKIPL